MGELTMLIRMLTCLLCVVAFGVGLTVAQDNPFDAKKDADNPFDKKAKVDPWVGKYRATEMSISVLKENGGYRGTIALGELQFTFKAKEIAGTLSGTFRHKQKEFPFTLKQTKDSHTFKSGTQSHTLKKVIAAKGPVKPNTRPDKSGLKHSMVLKRFKHSLGFTFQYPQKWTVKANDEGIVLTPPSPVSKNDQVQELYAISSEAVEDIKRIDDPEVTAFFDKSMKMKFPRFKRAAKMKLMQCAGTQGGFLTYRGSGTDGSTYRVNIYVTIIKRQGVYIFALGRDDVIAKRVGDLGVIFTSFGIGKAELDNKLVGKWYHFRGSSIGLGSEARSSSSYEQWLNLNKDGTCAMKSSSTIAASTADKGGVVVKGDAGNNSSVWTGIWSATKGKLTIVWSNGNVLKAPYSSVGAKGFILAIDGKKVPYAPAE